MPEKSEPPINRPRSSSAVIPTSSPVLNRLLENPPLGLFIADRLPNGFFTPTALERWGDCALYRALGIKAFKYLVPTGGKALAKQMGKPLLSGTTTKERLTCLGAFERWTRGVEASHWVGLTVHSSLAATAVASGHALLALAPLVATTIIDLYPIMLQRFNRVRLEDAMETLKARLQRP